MTKALFHHTSLLLSTFFALLLFANCKTERSRPDISDIQLTTQIERFEVDLFSIDTTQLSSELATLRAKYPDFFALYVEQVMQFAKASDTNTYEKQLRLFTTNKDMRFLYDTTMLCYPNLKKQAQELNQAFKYFKYYFPNKQVPEKVISHISAFGPAAVTYDQSILGINLDLHLGSDFPLYPIDVFPKYMRARLTPDYLSSNAIQALLKAHFENKPPKKRLIDQMIYEGKILYLTDLLLPDVPDSIKIGYTQAELAWCEASENGIWSFLVENELLYSTKQKEIFLYTSEAPTTKGLPTEAPGRIPIWVGWKIVKEFMDNNPDISPAQLMQITNAQEILKKARYKPRRGE